MCVVPSIYEASQHVRSFDWDDIARQTTQVYAKLSAGAEGARASLRPA